MDVVVTVTMAARLGGQTFIFSDCCSDAQHDPCQCQGLGKTSFGTNHQDFSFISYLAPIVQMRELRETCPGLLPTDAWKPEPVAHVGGSVFGISQPLQSGDLAQDEKCSQVSHVFR